MTSKVGELQPPKVGVEYVVDGHTIKFQNARQVMMESPGDKWYKALKSAPLNKGVKAAAIAELLMKQHKLHVVAGRNNELVGLVPLPSLSAPKVQTPYSIDGQEKP